MCAMRGGREKSDVLKQAARSPVMLISSRYFFGALKRKQETSFVIWLITFVVWLRKVVIGVVFASLGWTLRNILDLLTWNITMWLCRQEIVCSFPKDGNYSIHLRPRKTGFEITRRIIALSARIIFSRSTFELPSDFEGQTKH